MTTLQQIRGFSAQVKLDSSSCAVVEHGVGKVPTAVVIQTTGPGQLASVVPGSLTDTTFKVKFNWHTGSGFKEGTTILFLAVVTYEADEAEPEPEVPPTTRCETPIFSTAEPLGKWIKPGNPNVRVCNEVWNMAEAGPQILNVCDESSWSVAANHPKPGVPRDRFGSIKSYPCTQILFPKTPLNTINEMTSSWAHEAPALGEWNATYDIWFGGWRREVMIWMDHRYPASLPPSNATESTTVTIDRVTYTAWRRPNTKEGGTYIALVRQAKVAAGEVDLRAIFDWLVGKGWLAASDTLDAVDYGIEIASTDQKPQTFRLNHFDLVWDHS